MKQLGKRCVIYREAETADVLLETGSARQSSSIFKELNEGKERRKGRERSKEKKEGQKVNDGKKERAGSSRHNTIPRKTFQKWMKDKNSLRWKKRSNSWLTDPDCKKC